MVLSTEEQESIRSAYAKYHSLRKTAKQLRYSPNTIKKYVTGYYEVKEQNIVTELKSTDERLIGTYVGLWMGDGTQYKDNGGYIIKICLDGRNRELLQFVQWIFEELFGCVSWELTNINNNSHYIKVHSRFIFEFINNYCTYGTYKTETVMLKEPVTKYSEEFIEGCFLGLMLSDGHLKKQLCFNVTSLGLANNMQSILQRFGYRPTRYIQKRYNPNWNDLIHTKISANQSLLASKNLDGTLRKLGVQKRFSELKYKE